MIEKDPFGYQLAVYTWVVGISIIAGAVSYAQKIRADMVDRFSLMELLGEVLTAGFIGMITFWLCEWADFPMIFSAPVIGIASHMGSRLIFTLEKILEKKINGWLKKIGVIT